MRVASLYDVHGNLPALEAVLADPRLGDADAIVCGGDLVAGPMPVECLERLESLGDRVRFLRGNGDREAVTPVEGSPFVERARWCAAQLGPERLRRVGLWPPTVELMIEGLGRTLFCHAVPADDMPIVTTLTPAAEVERELGAVEAQVVVCGHVHVQYDRGLPGGVRLVNAGSVGAPYEGRAAAFWVLLGPEVEHVSTDYDVEAAVAAIEATGCPETEWLVRRALLEPLTAREAMEEFERMRGA